MLESKDITIEGKKYLYVKLAMEKAPLVLIKGSKGYVMCGYLNMETAEKLGDVAVRVKGVSDLDSILGATVESASTAAGSLGIKAGMPVRSIISKL